VKAKFIENGKEINGAQVNAYQNNREVFSFRWMDRVFVDEGAYEFRSNPNQDNKLSVKESFAAGDSKEIVFEMAKTVHVKLKLVASGSGDWYRHNYELWQGDEKKYSVHVHNGARVAPGAYSVVMPDDLTPHRHDGLVVTGEAAQTFEIEVPSAHLTAIYQTADGSRETDKRYFLYRGSRGKTKQSGQAVALTQGVYKIVGWRGNYDPVQIELKAGDTREVVLRNKQ
ncbi:MAG: hypothetical protein GY953_35820, partial [bacterium]|nr:hypothetical protein [bacterium]